MRKTTKYMVLEDFSAVKDDLVKSSKTFSITQTSQTKKIEIGNTIFYFTEDGVGKFGIVPYVNRIRREAREYMKNNYHKIISDKNEITFFGALNPPVIKRLDGEYLIEGVSKVDVSAAYFNAAIQLGIISDGLRKEFMDRFGNEPDFKKMRLMLLGCLATRKVKDVYIAGSIVPELQTEKVEETRDVYMFICRQISDLMLQSGAFKDAFYFYWDCVFTKDESAKKISEHFERSGYSCKQESGDNIYVDKIGSIILLTSEETKKAYRITDPYERINFLDI